MVIDFENASLKKEKIMLIGGGGFIGHHLSLELRKKEAKVMVVDNLQINNIVHMLSSEDFDLQKRGLYINFII